MSAGGPPGIVSDRIASRRESLKQIPKDIGHILSQLIYGTTEQAEKSAT